MQSKKRYKDLLSEKQFLRVAERARQLTGTQLVSIQYDESELIFKTLSATRKGVYYEERIKITSLQEHQDMEYMRAMVANSKLLSAEKKEAKLMGMSPVLATKGLDKALRNSTLKISCTCPAWHYWGYKYYAWRQGYGLMRENRYPKVRQPSQRGYVCKHLYVVLQIYPFIANTVAKKLKTAGIVKDSVENARRVKKENAKK